MENKNDYKHEYTLLSDCDGVLVSWFSNIGNFLNSKGMCSKHLSDLVSGNPINHYSLLFPAKTDEESYKLLIEYNNSEFISKLSVLEKESVQSILRISQLVNIVIVTNISENIGPKEKRMANLKEIYNDSFSDIHCLPVGSDKTNTLTMLSSNLNVIMWLDDCLHHVKEGLAAGIKNSYQFTYDMTCGRNTGEVPELNSWIKVEEKINTILSES